MLQSRVRRMLTRAAGPLVLVGLFVAMIGATVSLEADSGVGGVLTPEGVRAVSPGASTHPALPPIPEPQPQSTTLKQQCKDGAAVSSSNDALAGDCAVLLGAKDTLRGTGSLNWSTATAISSWDGITLWGTPQRVDWITLRSKSLTGTIPPELGSLALSRLDLRGNSLTGSIPAELGNLTAVTSLYLHNNDLSGPIPAELGNMASLSELALFGNDLSGSIPPELSNLRRLRSLYLDDNDLSGSIPPELLDLPLRLLRLSDNPSLTGCVPPGLDDIASNDLDDLDLDECPSTYTLTTTAGANGSVSPSGTSTEDYADSVEITATPDSGYRVAGWSGACSAAEGTTCSVRMLDNLTVGVTFELPEQTLTVTVTGPGGTVTPTGATQQPADSDVTLTASWNDATHSFTGWSGDCVATTSTCVVTMDANKAVTATFAALPADRCATTTAADCIRAVYRGAPGDYAQVADIPADKLLTASSSGHYHVERGQQYTVVTAAQLPEGWTRFYLQRDPGPTFGVPSPVSFSQLIKPIGTTYTFTVSDESGLPSHPQDCCKFDYDFKSPPQFTYELLRAKPFVRPRPDGKPFTGDAVVSTTFQVPRFGYGSFDSGAMDAGSYGLLMPDDDPDDDQAITAVTTYEELRTETTVLRVNVTDEAGDDQSAFLATVNDDTLVEWRLADDCWARYQVTAAPTGTGITRDIAVRWYSYAATGCTGPLDLDSAAITLDWDPSYIPSSAMKTPVRHGPWLMSSRSWDGERETAVEVDLPDDQGPGPVGTDVNPPSHPLYREATVPAGWQTDGHSWGRGHDFPVYGYVQLYYDSDRKPAATIVVSMNPRIPDIRWTYARGYREAWVVDGYTAILEYASAGMLAQGLGDDTEITHVWLYDPETDLQVLVVGHHESLLGGNIEGTIAIALSVMNGGQ